MLRLCRGSMSRKAYKAGSPFPPLTAGKLRIYSMRFCPFAHRVLLVLAAKGIDHEVINIDLQNKPEWLYQVHPVGKVPVLQQDNKVLNESLIVSEYLDEAFGGLKLLPSDPYLKARDKMFIEVGSSAATTVLKIYSNKDGRAEIWTAFLEKLKVIEDELAARTTPYLSGDRPGFPDYMTWPFFSAAAGLSAVFPELKMPSPDQYPLLAAWIGAMRKAPAVSTVISEPQLIEFIESKVIKQKPNYDVGL